MQYFPTVIKNGLVVLGSSSYDVSSQVREATLTRRFELLDDTRFGLTARSRVPGLEDWSAEVNFIQNFGTTSSGPFLDEILSELIASPLAFPIRLRPYNAARSSANPEYTGNVFAEAHTPMAGEVGSLLMTRIPFVSAGNLSRLTSSSS